MIGLIHPDRKLRHSKFRDKTKIVSPPSVFHEG